jgi:hypothetical protein
MSASNVRALKKRAAKRPAPRVVSYTAPDDSEYPGWSITIRADFPAKRLAAFQSGSLERMLDAIEGLVVDHNLPNEDDEIAESLGDVSPYEGLLYVIEKAMDGIDKLPPR